MRKEEIIKLNRLARKLKTTYEIIRGKTSPGYRAHPKFEDCWMRVAKVVDRLGADPVLYIDAQFMVPSERVPYPNSLHSDESIARYKKIAARPESPYQMEINNQVRYLQDYVKMEPDMSIDEILLDPKVSLKNFFRVIMCSPDVSKEAVKLYGKRAEKELEFNPGLKEAIKNTYGTRYSRIFSERLSNRISIEPSEDPGPPSKAPPSGNYPKRRHRRSQ